MIILWYLMILSKMGTVSEKIILVGKSFSEKEELNLTAWAFLLKVMLCSTYLTSFTTYI